MDQNYLSSALRQFKYYEKLANDALEQLDEKQLFEAPNEESNSLAIIMKHMVGNMLSRWTDFLTSDGEKTWRNRDVEFENNFETKEELMAYWLTGWTCLYQAIEPLTEADLSKIIYIRNEGHSVMEAINRQLCHYSYHVGQLVFLAKMFKNESWQSLSIPKNKSADYNQKKFEEDKDINLS
jgi:hypothetical protein